ncbi:hypothetical protein B0H13DRAFT_1854799 [Mycena leptocephala]|nr:hypothetical protein B0H13DRAFT_1854799 [Mycena leptocephala]
MLKRKNFKPRNVPCLAPGCPRLFLNASGVTNHMKSAHTPFNAEASAPDRDIPMGSPPGSRASSVRGGGDAAHGATPLPPRLASPPPRLLVKRHATMNGRPCDRNGNFLRPDTPPTPLERPTLDDFTPYAERADFELADLLYRRVQMSAGAIDELMQNWAARPDAPDPPFADHDGLYNTIDIIVEDPATRGSTFVPVILGSDKTTVSVAIGQNEYYPLYMSNGLVYNGVRRAHRNAVTLIGFLAIPKTDRENQDSVEFRTFRRNLFHGSLRHILQSLKSGMTVPEVTLFGDGHYRRVIYGLGPYIADYPEQVLLACVVQGWCPRSSLLIISLGVRRRETISLPFTWDFPRADIYELLSPDLLHQVIKGTFKDHLVAWVGEYLENEHGKAEAKKIMADIDRRIAAVPPFPGLRRFSEGRGFKQWTGDDSKALMKVYLPAIEGQVPPQMLRAISAFLDFCYLVRRNVIDEATLTAIDAALARYHRERTIFVESGVCPNGFCLPRQHLLTRYRYLIQEFGASNGLCSSITESKHIKAVKQPWRRSSRYEALSQMLTINDRLDKLAAARVDFTARGMMAGPAAQPLPVPNPIPPPPADDDDDGGPSDERKILGEVILARNPMRSYLRNPAALAQFLDLPSLVPLVQRFLYLQDHPDHDLNIALSDIPLDNCPDAPRSIKVFPSAIAKFYAPSDQSGIRGMLHERIRTVRSWRGGAARYDCVFVEGNPDLPSFRGLLAARILLFMSFKHDSITYPCH